MRQNKPAKRVAGCFGGLELAEKARENLVEILLGRGGARGILRAFGAGRGELLTAPVAGKPVCLLPAPGKQRLKLPAKGGIVKQRDGIGRIAAAGPVPRFLNKALQAFSLAVAKKGRIGCGIQTVRKGGDIHRDGLRAGVAAEAAGISSLPVVPGVMPERGVGVYRRGGAAPEQRAACFRMKADAFKLPVKKGTVIDIDELKAMKLAKIMVETALIHMVSDAHTAGCEPERAFSQPHSPIRRSGSRSMSVMPSAFAIWPTIRLWT